MQDIPRHCPVLDSSTESTHLDDHHKAVCKCAIRLRLSLCLDSLFASGKVKLGESRRASYGVVGVQASETQFSLLCLVVVLPISANGAVYRQRCMQTSGLAKTFPWAWSWNRDFVLGAQSRLGRSGYRGLL
jgi:hypothetical protein